MECRKVHALLHNEELHFPSETLEPFWIPSSSPSFHGSSSMLSFENGCGESSYLRKEEGCDDDCNGFFLQPGKKRRLEAGQVQFLEKYFGEENKLEPQRKAQLAKEVGLQPRQVAIWFQNRRARYKTKQLEKDYDSLKASYDQLQSEFDDVLKEKEKLREEVLFLKDKLRVIDDREGVPIPKTGHETGYDVEPLMLVCKQEDASSAKSDVLDSNSPHYTEAAGSSDVFGSDFDEGGDSGLSFLKLHHPNQKHDPNAVASSCNFGLPTEDQFFCFWP